MIFYKKWKKYYKIQLTKNKMDLNIRKITTHPPSPEPDKLTRNNNQSTRSDSTINDPRAKKI